MEYWYLPLIGDLRQHWSVRPSPMLSHGKLSSSVSSQNNEELSTLSSHPDDVPTAEGDYSALV